MVFATTSTATCWRTLTLNEAAGAVIEPEERLATAIQIAAIPQKIRGYGHIKEASVAPAKAEETALWSRWEKQALTVPAEA